jgi:hypothetical protein
MGVRNRVFLEGDKLEVAVIRRRWVLTHLPADPRRRNRLDAIFAATETALHQ